ncbi:MAG: hypothetical protein JRH16_15090 [Deltaproteobacteria bacterium]|nr:hypothetical protein [Deltaproteobacteria bacterium]MBW2360111.1 hypothetical protein [Deltaproteobacteria bacterium]
MAGLGPIGLVGFGALGVVVLLWLVISFSDPGRGRSLLEWLAATHLYVALGALFYKLVLDAWADGSLVGQIGFGFLLLVFALGFCVSLVNTLRALGGGAGGVGSDGAAH